ncbi:MAG TPA: sugar ABC transporter ATP-binding protein [Bryobacteraceae bacterium]|nr:sugar ABC transporter ATP-binding protein [Bryobacteraceae bacterium]
MNEIVLAARGISKQYPGALALDHVDFLVCRGQVNVVIGENGAGKSTLMKILAGVERPTAGVLELEGHPIRLASTRDAAALGIAMIHQELNLLPNLNVADNIFMAREETNWGVIRHRSQERAAAELMLRLEQPIDPRTLVGDLPLGQQQVVEIAKAIARDVRVLIMDEPTSALSATEIDVLFRLIRDLKSRGVSIIYISHRLEELLTIGDQVMVLRDGRVVAESPAETVSVSWIVERMTGRAFGASSRSECAAPGRPLMTVESLSMTGPTGRAVLRNLSFQVCAGEIVGFYGLLGAGRTELFECMIGLRHAERGSIVLDGKAIGKLALPERIDAGLVLVPEDRKAAGIVPELSVRENITLANLRSFASGPFLSFAKERRRSEQLVREMNIRAAGLDRPITSLSGGNQQKVVLSRFLLTEPKVLLLDEPTRGVDVGARAEIFDMIRRLAAQGMAVLFASTELKEIRALATRVIVMSLGRMAAEFTAAEATEDALVAASSPVSAPREGGDSVYR